MIKTPWFLESFNKSGVGSVGSQNLKPETRLVALLALSQSCHFNGCHSGLSTFVAVFATGTVY